MDERTGEALKLQRPLPDGCLRIVAQGSGTDEIGEYLAAKNLLETLSSDDPIENRDMPSPGVA